METDRNDLFVIAFMYAEDANKAWQALKVMRSSFTFSPERSRLVERDRSGKVVVHEYKLLSTSERKAQSKVFELFIDAIFGDSDEKFRQFMEAGLDETFLRDVSKALRPDSSALVIYLPHDSLVDRHNLKRSLEQLRGTLYHTSFPSKVEAAILALEHKYGPKPDMDQEKKSDAK